MKQYEDNIIWCKGIIYDYITVVHSFKYIDTLYTIKSVVLVIYAEGFMISIQRKIGWLYHCLHFTVTTYILHSVDH